MKKIIPNQNGFTMIELTIVTSILTIFFILAMPGFLRAQSSDREAEVKANCQTIQIALERYMVDNNEYPAYLLGGDIDGWLNWHSDWSGVNDIHMSEGRVASNDRLQEPLIEFDYITSYPNNPFVDNGGLIVGRTNIDGITEPGNGDPRFGYSGNRMGQGLDDMNFFRGATHQGPFNWSEIETRRTLDHGAWMDIPAGFQTEYLHETNMYYLFGGFRNPYMDYESSRAIYTFWPGNFFYKATPDIMLGRQGWTIPLPNTNPGGPYHRYIIGVYGAEGTEGVDVIRLTWSRPDGDTLYWRCPPPFSPDCFYLGYNLLSGSFGQPGGLPEVFGGGDEDHGPFWPYDFNGEEFGEFTYGAPDGVPDGVVLVLTDKGHYL